MASPIRTYITVGRQILRGNGIFQYYRLSSKPRNFMNLSTNSLRGHGEKLRHLNLRLLSTLAGLGLLGSVGLKYYLRPVLAVSNDKNDDDYNEDTENTSNTVSNRVKYNFIADIVEKAVPAVVYIEVVARSPFHSVLSNGSGFIVNENGIILTNAHVVANRTNVVVKLHDGRKINGTVLITDPVSDLATIKINASKLPVLKLGKSESLRTGEWVIAMGSPFSLANTVTSGIVSTPLRGSEELGLHHQNMSYIQTDAVINFGNSGGPLINLDGEVIGINTLKVTTGISFAIPSDYAKKFLLKTEQFLSNTHKKSWIGSSSPTFVAQPRHYIGITMLTLNPSILITLKERLIDFPDVSHGIYIHKIIIDSPADRAGLKVGDVIVAVNNKNVSDSSDVYKAIESGQLLTLSICRRRQTLNIKIEPEMIYD
ncbi:serine protease HTRA2, mitochondrial [Octopus sinensis]|uniref:Serine protease HTRA2, mitochondrial n=1 Tax=Octopus sinensis TaxID=2607531 RepID=A0A6P7T6J3_9MOLL|nr:serine protease HTRA2, mitochondrial [Octopus sinensis]